ncbi:hypothetical protein ADL04_10715, partial [Streptomyces sp. NRRL B-3648]
VGVAHGPQSQLEAGVEQVGVSAGHYWQASQDSGVSRGQAIAAGSATWCTGMGLAAWGWAWGARGMLVAGRIRRPYVVVRPDLQPDPHIDEGLPIDAASRNRF